MSHRLHKDISIYKSVSVGDGDRSWGGIVIGDNGSIIQCLANQYREMCRDHRERVDRGLGIGGV